MGSFGLPALQVRPPQQTENPVEQYVKLKSLLGQQQLQQQALQEGNLGIQEKQNQLQAQQRAQQDNQVVQQALAATGGDLDKAAQATYGKVSPQTTFALQKAHRDAQKEVNELDAAERAKRLDKADRLSALVQQAQQMDDATYAQNYPQIAAAAKQIDPSINVPPQPIPRAQLGQLQIGLNTSKFYLEQKAEERKNQEFPLDLKKKQADTDKAQAEADALKANPGLMPGIPLDKLEAADWLKKNPGKTISDFTVWKAQHSPSAMNNINVLSPDSIDLAAQLYRKTGQLPSGFSRSPQTTAAVMKRAAEQAKEEGGDAGDIAQNKLNYKTYQQQAAKAQPQFVAIDTANQHLDLAGKAALALQNGDIQLLNKIGNAYGVQVGKDPATTFNAIMTVAGPEIVRASAQSGQMSEREIEKARSNFSTNMSPSQIASNVAAMRQLMSGKKAALQKNLQSLKGGNVTGGDNQQAAPQVTNIHVNPKTGEKIGWNGSAWVPVP